MKQGRGAPLMPGGCSSSPWPPERADGCHGNRICCHGNFTFFRYLERSFVETSAPFGIFVSWIGETLLPIWSILSINRLMCVRQYLVFFIFVLSLVLCFVLHLTKDRSPRHVGETTTKGKPSFLPFPPPLIIFPPFSPLLSSAHFAPPGPHILFFPR